MEGAMRHVVNKLTFEMACKDEQQAFKAREGFLKDLYDEMVSVIEACCNRVSDDRQLLQIDKLEINLRTFRYDFWGRQEYLKLFETALERELIDKASTAENQAMQPRTIQQSHSDIIFYFLGTGSLPWWTAESEVHLDEWCSEIINSEEAANFISRLYENKNRSRLWQRIAYQLPAAFKEFIISKIPVFSDVQEKIRELIDQQKLSLAHQREMDDMVNDFILKNGCEILTEPNISTDALFGNFILSAGSDNEIEDLQELYKTPQINIFNEREVAGQGTSDGHEIGKMAEKTTGEKLIAGNAGIILVTSFLKKFYTNLGLYSEGEWVSEKDRCKAVYLLHYLATGEEAAFEYQLTLEKIICGIPLSDPLDKNVTLSEREKEESDDLLSAVIRHWAALKNTSANGLRHSFLQREGLLHQKENGWLLQVERRTMDILLEQLPWGYATVILPWNKYIIYTEW